MFSAGLIFVSVALKVFNPYWLCFLAVLVLVGYVCGIEMKRRNWT